MQSSHAKHVQRVTVVTHAGGCLARLFRTNTSLNSQRYILIGCGFAFCRAAGNFGFSRKGSYNFGNAFGGLKIDA